MSHMPLPFFPDIDDAGREGALSRQSRLGWVEESFAFESPVGRQTALAVERAHLGSSFSRQKQRRALALAVSVMLILALRLIFLQVVRGSSYRLAAEGNRERIVPIFAERGLIFDRRGIPLTKNIPNFSLILLPHALPRSPSAENDLAARLSFATGIPAARIAERIGEYRDYRLESIVIQEHLDYNAALTVYASAGELPGIGIQVRSRRLYSAAGNATTTISLAHILGYEGKLTKEDLRSLYAEGYLPSDAIGKSGIEKSYERYLRGSYGRRRAEVDAAGREQQTLAEISPSPGGHIALAIDVEMQAALEGFLADELRASGRRRGAAIALDPRNGDILSLVSLPAFDNNAFAGGLDENTFLLYADNPDQPLFNRAIGGAYPSGSTIKPAIAAAGLNEGVITEKTSILSTGGIQAGPWFFPDWKPGGHGATDARKSLAQSVNTFYYYVGGGHRGFAGLGVERLTEYLKRFGFSSLLGIDIPGEASGFLPSKEWKRETKGEVWYIGDTYNLSIGQGDLLVTPLQLASMTAVIANGGTLYRPRLVREFADAVTGARRAPEPSVIRQAVVSPDALKIVRLGMRDCVISGSCRRLSALPFSVAGKTGTAQWKSDRPTHAWFTSFAPFDEPEIIVTVLIEEGGEGSATATPVAEHFYRWWWNYKRNGG